MCRLETFHVQHRKLCYARLGDDECPPIACIHGVLRSWNTFLPLTSHLVSAYELLAIDQRGHGTSDRADRYLVVDYVADVAAWLREAVGRPTVLYGHSLGAMVAAAVAAECPALVRGVVMEDPPFDTMGSRLRELELHSYFEQLRDIVRNRLPISRLACALAEVTTIDHATGNPTTLGKQRDAASLRFFASTLQRVDPPVFDPIVDGRWLDGYDADEVFGNLRCPVMLLQADQTVGGMLSDADVARIKSLAPDVTHVRLSGAGHAIHWQRTQEAANLTISFLESLDGAA